MFAHWIQRFSGRSLDRFTVKILVFYKTLRIHIDCEDVYANFFVRIF
jgi:hypothetical protein